VEGSELDRVPVYLADVEVFAHLGHFRRLCFGPLISIVIFCLIGTEACTLLTGIWYAAPHTFSVDSWWSVKVSQCDLSMRVTTRPGASGVPRWSSLW
jgi:hypothetical protein